MIPRKLLGRAEVPGGGELRLMRRGAEYSIMLGSTELMNSRQSGSEEALAALACARVPGDAHVLIGGLGMGFTLRAALDALAEDARLIVAELVPAVVEWARGPMAEIFGGSLADPRVTVVEEDVAASIDCADGAYDAILLDVDNGPDGLTRAENDRLYSAAGLARARAALRPGGVLAVWSSAPDQAFSRRLRKAGFEVEEAAVRARGSRGGRHVIWLAARDATIRAALR